MDDKEFRRHLRDLAHGKHNLDEHDWASVVKPPKQGVKKRTKRRR